MNHVPKKFVQVAQIFTKQSKGNEGHTMHKQWPTYKVRIFLHVNVSYELKNTLKLKEIAVSSISTAEDINDTSSTSLLTTELAYALSML